MKGPLNQVQGAGRGRVRRKRVLGSEVLAPVPRGAQDRAKGKKSQSSPRWAFAYSKSQAGTHTLGCRHIWSGILVAHGPERRREACHLLTLSLLIWVMGEHTLFRTFLVGL